MATIDVGDLVVGYDEHGSGEPLVLLHGGESDRRMFDLFVPHLGPGIRAIACDERDSGETRNGSDPYSMTDLGNDCAELIGALGLDQAHVMGTSFGGMVAMSAAIARPDRVRSLVLSATSPGGRVGADDIDGIRKGAREAVEGGPEARSRFMSELLFSPGYLDAHPEVRAELAERLVVRTPEAAARRNAAWWEHDACDALAAISVPTLVIHGRDDPGLSVANAEFLAEHIPHAELVVLDGLRHGLTFEDRERAASAIRDFVLAHA